MATPFKFEQREVNGSIERKEFFRDGTDETTTFRPNIGDVLATDTACTNPYTFRDTQGLREKAFALFRRAAAGKASGGDWMLAQQVQLWYAPSCGGALRISPECINWQHQTCRHDRITFRAIKEPKGYHKLFKPAELEATGTGGCCDECGLVMVRVRSPLSHTGWWWCDEAGDPVRPATDGKLPGGL
ncbi:MAG: hypothetical protein EPN91_08700 [Salinibacterium sp.]|nr:MAG: hypothetical protein EPN91_08700 [Salinibacterium sp.]